MGVVQSSAGNSQRPNGTDEIIVGTLSYNDEILIALPRSAVNYLADLFKALASATWGEVRRNSANSEIYAEILGQAGYGSAEEYVSKIDIGRPVPGALEAALHDYAAKAGEPLPD